MNEAKREIFRLFKRLQSLNILGHIRYSMHGSWTRRQVEMWRTGAGADPAVLPDASWLEDQRLRPETKVGFHGDGNTMPKRGNPDWASSKLYGAVRDTAMNISQQAQVGEASRAIEPTCQADDSHAISVANSIVLARSCGPQSFRAPCGLCVWRSRGRSQARIYGNGAKA
jgi:hypothetical protein